jgi:hypothetical protein
MARGSAVASAPSALDELRARQRDDAKELDGLQAEATRIGNLIDPGRHIAGADATTAERLRAASMQFDVVRRLLEVRSRVADRQPLIERLEREQRAGREAAARRSLQPAAAALARQLEDARRQCREMASRAQAAGLPDGEVFDFETFLETPVALWCRQWGV